MKKRLVYCLSLDRPYQTINGLSDLPIKWEKHGSIYLATNTPTESLLGNATIQNAFSYQQISQRIHAKIDMLPLRFPTVVDEDKIAGLIAGYEQKIERLIEKYGGMAEHSFYVDLKRLKSKPPASLEGGQEGLAYLRRKYERYKTEAVSIGLVAEIEESVKSIFQDLLQDHKIATVEGNLIVHLLCKRKEGFQPAQISAFSDAIQSFASLKEMGVFPPFHFVDFTTMVSTP